MRYLRSFQLSPIIVKNPNVYPYSILRNKSAEVLVFDTITVLHGSNGSGKSTLLNILALKLGLVGAETPKVFGRKDYMAAYLAESNISFETKEETNFVQRIPEQSRYLKSEDILYEVKKIQQEAILAEHYVYEQGKLGQTKAQREACQTSFAFAEKLIKTQFCQEKYSNGETAMALFSEYLEPGGLYLLDEPEVSLAPASQIELVALINEAARFFDCQFIIATHSPFLLANLVGTIYDVDREGLVVTPWQKLASVQLYQKLFRLNN